MKIFYLLFLNLLFNISNVFSQKTDSIFYYKNILKKYATNYVTKGINIYTLDTLSEPPLLVKRALFVLDSNKCDEVKIFTSLIVLKIYKAHLICCHQSYELRNYPYTDLKNNIILYFLLKNTNIFNFFDKTEYIPSSFVYDNIKSGNLQIRYNLINKEVKSINKILRKIN